MLGVAVVLPAHDLAALHLAPLTYAELAAHIGKNAALDDAIRVGATERLVNIGTLRLLDRRRYMDDELLGCSLELLGVDAEQFVEFFLARLSDGLWAQCRIGSQEVAADNDHGNLLRLATTAAHNYIHLHVSLLCFDVEPEKINLLFTSNIIHPIWVKVKRCKKPYKKTVLGRLQGIEP